MPLLEKDIQDQILEFLKYQKGFYWRNNTGAWGGEYKGKPRFVRFGIKGQADISGILPNGRRVEIEVKRPGNKLSPEQLTFLDGIKYYNGLAIVAYCLEDVQREFEKISVNL